MRRLLVTVLVLGLLLVVGDRVAAGVAGNQAERRLAAHGFAASSVQFHDFPFLTQLVERRFLFVSLSSQHVHVKEGQASDVRAQLHGVQAEGQNALRVSRLEADGTVPYAEVVRAAGVPSLRLGPAPGGQVRISRTVDLLGQHYTVSTRAHVRAMGTRLQVEPTSVELQGGGALDNQLSQLLAGRIAIDYPVPNLPQGVRIAGVTAGPSGFVVHVTGQNVLLAER